MGELMNFQHRLTTTIRENNIVVQKIPLTPQPTEHKSNPETKTKLKTKLLAGKSYSDIGKWYGVTRQAVYQRVLLFGLKNLKSSLLEKRNQRIVKLHNRKISIKDIAEQFGLSIQQTYRIIQQSRKTPLHSMAKKHLNIVNHE